MVEMIADKELCTHKLLLWHRSSWDSIEEAEKCPQRGIGSSSSSLL